MGRFAQSSALTLLGLAVTGCSLISLDNLQGLDGSGGAGATGTSTVDAAASSTVASAVSTGDTSAASQSSVTATASTASSSGVGGEGGGGGAGGGGGGGSPTDAYAQEVLADGPLVYLRLDDAPGETSIADTLGNHDGTLVGGAAWREPGAVAGGFSIQLDGTSGAIVLGDVLDFPAGVPFSVELWAKRVEVAPPLPTSEWLVSKESGTGPTRGGYLLLLSDQLEYGAEVWSDGEARVAYKTSPTPIGVWTHLVVTGDAADLLVYVDGIAFDSGGSSTILQDTDGSLIFGAQAGIQNNFDGWLDEIAVYDVVLPPARIAAHRAAAQR